MNDDSEVIENTDNSRDRSREKVDKYGEFESYSSQSEYARPIHQIHAEPDNNLTIKTAAIKKKFTPKKIIYKDTSTPPFMQGLSLQQKNKFRMTIGIKRGPIVDEFLNKQANEEAKTPSLSKRNQNLKGSNEHAMTYDPFANVKKV